VQTKPAPPIARPEQRFQRKQSLFKSAVVVSPATLGERLRALPQRNVDGVLLHVKGERMRADGLTKEETNALFADSKRDVGKLREHLIGLIFTNAGDAANCDLVAIDPGAGQYAVHLGASGRIDLIDFSKEHASWLRDEYRCHANRKMTRSQYLRSRSDEVYWSSFAKSLCVAGRRTIVIYGASFTRGTFLPIRALTRHGAYCVRLDEFRSSKFSSMSDTELEKIECQRSFHVCENCVGNFCRKNGVKRNDAEQLVAPALLAAPLQPQQAPGGAHVAGGEANRGPQRGHHHNRRRSQHEHNDTGRPVHPSDARTALIDAERARINAQRQRARDGGPHRVPFDIDDEDVDFNVVTAMSGRHALSAMARHSVQDRRDDERFERFVRECGLGCQGKCEHNFKAFDVVAAARSQHEQRISELSTRTLRRRAQRAKMRDLWRAPADGEEESEHARERAARRVRHRHRKCYECEKEFNGGAIYILIATRALWRYKKDTSVVDKHKRVHRDISACVNFVRIVIGLLESGKWPFPFWSFENSPVANGSGAASQGAHVH